VKKGEKEDFWGRGGGGDISLSSLARHGLQTEGERSCSKTPEKKRENGDLSKEREEKIRRGFSSSKKGNLIRGKGDVEKTGRSTLRARGREGKKKEEPYTSNPGRRHRLGKKAEYRARKKCQVERRKKRQERSVLTISEKNGKKLRRRRLTSKRARKTANLEEEISTSTTKKKEFHHHW